MCNYWFSLQWSTRAPVTNILDVPDPTKIILSQLLPGQYIHLICTGHFVHLNVSGCWSHRHPRESPCFIYWQKGLLQCRNVHSSVPCLEQELAPHGPTHGSRIRGSPGCCPARARCVTAPSATSTPQPRGCWLPVSKDSLQLKWFKSLVVLMIQVINKEIWIK